MEQLKNSLADWTNADLAAFYMADSKGLIAKWIPFESMVLLFRTRNMFHTNMKKELKNLVEKGILEYDEITNRYRWKPDS